MNTLQPKWVTPDIILDAQLHSRREYPKESCGLVTKSKGYLPCENVASDPIKEFEINPSVLIENPDTLGVIHSHTNGNYAPGRDDMESQIATGLAWGVLVCSGDASSKPIWWGGDTPIAPLLGRQFMHGVHDCYSLIRDYYRLERGITLKDYPRDNLWWESGANLYESYFQDAGFYQIPNDPMMIQPGDVFFAKVRSNVENHGGLYIGDGLVMHHVGGHLSLTSPAGGWMKLVTRWVRYGVKP